MDFFKLPGSKTYRHANCYTKQVTSWGEGFTCKGGLISEPSKSYKTLNIGLA